MFFNFDDLKIYYRIVGKVNNMAKPILFLHGWGGDANSFKIFERNLKNETMCVFISFPPFGKSSNLSKPYTIKTYSDIVIKLLDNLKISNVNIVAHSFGGRIAIYVASHNKFLVNSMILTGCAGLKRKELKIKFKIFTFKVRKFFAKLKLYPSKKLINLGSEDYKKLSKTMKQTFVNVVNFDEKFLLKRIECQTLLVWGKLDKETPFYFTKIFKKNIKNSEVIVFKKSGHFAYLENPKAFLLIIKSFFNL